MRLWTIHPKYLDGIGLIALWRESLLAQAVLQGKTKGYKNHPQLTRFKNCKNPNNAISRYIETIYKESIARNYNFNASKLSATNEPCILYCTTGQMEYELNHLKIKLKNRDKIMYESIKHITEPEQNPIFTVINGGIENWERVKS